MQIRFTKMQGAGNDFVVLDGLTQPFTLDRRQLRRLADRHFGVGADQILVVEAAPDASADFRYRIFNADGDEVEQCGNGARCFVKYVHSRGFTDQRSVRVITQAGPITLELLADGAVRVDMGLPDLATAACGFDDTGLRADGQGRWQLDLGPSGMADFFLVSMGNPHAVQFAGDPQAAPVAQQGPALEHHPRFGRGVNAGFAHRMDRHRIALRVWERGSGETLACGTGACAAAVAGIRQGLLSSPVEVQTRGGILQIDWAGGASDSVGMTGPAETVFEGEITL
jgi:diaminopimelate epimerase